MKSSLFSRYTCFVLSILLTLVFLIMMHNHPWFWLPALACGCLMVLGIYDLTQQRHAICRNYPIIGRLRFFFEFIRPELRQYFLEQDNEEIPFSRTQRTLVYRRAKNEMGDKPFGTLLDVYQTGYECIGHSMRPVEAADPTSFRITIGGADCRQPYSASIFNISAMSFGALSANAIRALNLGAAKGNFYHDTGEGSISRYHRENNGDLVWELGSGYFGRGFAGTRRACGAATCAAGQDTTPLGSEWGFSRPGEVFAVLAAQDVNRLTGSGTANWRPSDFLTARVTVGMDHSSLIDTRFQALNEGPNFSTNRRGGRTDNRFEISQTTVDAGATPVLVDICSLENPTMDPADAAAFSRGLRRGDAQFRDYEDGLWGGAVTIEAAQAAEYLLPWPATGARVTLSLGLRFQCFPARAFNLASVTFGSCLLGRRVPGLGLGGRFGGSIGGADPVLI